MCLLPKFQFSDYFCRKRTKSEQLNFPYLKMWYHYADKIFLLNFFSIFKNLECWQNYSHCKLDFFHFIPSYVLKLETCIFFSLITVDSSTLITWDSGSAMPNRRLSGTAQISALNRTLIEVWRRDHVMWFRTLSSKTRWQLDFLTSSILCSGFSSFPELLLCHLEYT